MIVCVSSSLLLCMICVYGYRTRGSKKELIIYIKFVGIDTCSGSMNENDWCFRNIMLVRMMVPFSGYFINLMVFVEIK